MPASTSRAAASICSYAVSSEDHLMKRHLSTLAIALVAGALAAGATQTLFSAFADQSERVPPTSGIFTGVQFSQLIGNAVRSISTGNKGATAPANVGGDVVD